MENSLNFKVDGTTAATTAFIPALSFITIATGLVTLVGFGRGVNRSLNQGCACLGLYMGHGFCHHILLGQGIWQNRAWYGRNLHVFPWVKTHMKSLLTERGEETFKHLVGKLGLEKCLKNSLLGLNLGYGI